jgi:lipopolysaccharide transport system ATP-binding protein
MPSDNIAIRVSHLSKQYRLGGPQEPYHTFRDAIVNSLRAPLKVFHREPPAEGFWALKNASFEVEQGEVVGIIGRNGAGKSTLLKILSRITSPTEGTVELHGRVGSLLEVGTGFHPELTGRENIYLSGSILGMKRREIDAKLDEIVKFSEIEKFLDTPVKRYSSGMYVRLAFAVAAHLEPEILLVDEVLAVGDAAFQKKCLGKMGDVAKEGRTVLFVSHNMVSLQSLCDRGILLESGSIKMDGEITVAIGRYLQSNKTQSGEISWSSQMTAPGDHQARLKAVQVVQNNKITPEVDIDKEFRVEVDYWNLRPESRRVVSIHIINSMGVTILTSSNMNSVCITPDPWFSRPYPTGLFRTTCIIPGFLLNAGMYSISVFINVGGASDTIIFQKEILSFTVRETGAMRDEYLGEWLGVIRPRLDWHTDQLE